MRSNDCKALPHPRERGGPLLERFVDVYEQVTNGALPVESALKSIAGG